MSGAARSYIRNNILQSNVVITIVITVQLLNRITAAAVDQTELFSQQAKVEELVREWAPLVWLAPNEKFMPGDVTEFLQHVHAEKVKQRTSEEDLQIDDQEQLYYYDIDNEFSTLLAPEPPNQWERRHKRMYKDNYLYNYIIDLPIGEHSSNWFLVTNDNIDDLLNNPTSFIYGQSPNIGNVPIYAMVTVCNSTISKPEEDVQMNLIDSKIGHRRSTYIPVSNSLLQREFSRPQQRTAVSDDSNATESTPNDAATRQKRELSSTPTDLIIDDALGTNVPMAVELNEQNDSEDNSSKVVNTGSSPSQLSNSFNGDVNEEKGTFNEYPHFQVTYWMFYPYSQGKSICTVSLGPFGHLPIPQIFGVCLGTKKDFGSHVGDWEHMSLLFNGRKEPDQMYVSAHDAGAYYAYERLTGTFEFRRQETRKGILQHPNFPTTVVTSKNHPVLFSAQGSHGLWTAPGKHRFVRVARLFDVNGFGTAWPTWKHVQIAYESERGGRSIGPEWLRFNGRWGNPKSKCHPLKKVGLNFCEYTDGPTGIPVKSPHFYCPK